MGQYNTASSGIKVLDRAVAIATAVADGPISLAELCEVTGLPRATVHRLATALEVHNILARRVDGKWITGPALAHSGVDTLISSALPIMNALVQRTGESVQLYRLTGTQRTCIASQEPPSGLKYTVPVGARMELTAGSAARIFIAFSGPALRERILPEARYTAAAVDEARAQGWSESRNEREAGLASVSAPVFGPSGELAAVLSLSGPSERFVTTEHVPDLLAAARELGAALSSTVG